LWGRLGRMGQDPPLPPGWGVEDMVVAVASERARRGGEQGTEKIMERLESGEPVSDTERRVVFGQMARANPLGAVKFWCRVTPPGDFEHDAPWLADALTDPATRSAVMAEVRKWQAGGDVAGTTSFLAGNWLRRDPAAVAQWLAEPAQADIRPALLPEVIAARAGANPAETWNWAQTLPEQQRRQTLEMSAAHLAGTDPEGGMKLIAALPASAARREIVTKFGEALAGQDFARWRQWRDTLPRAEQDAVNASAFTSWVIEDGTNAVAWLQARPVGADKDALVTVLVETYAKDDPAGAARWIASIPDPARREEAFHSALVMTGYNDLERVKILLGGLAGD
jgi:hypothetical protein